MKRAELGRREPGESRNAVPALVLGLVLSGMIVSLRLPILPLFLRDELSWSVETVGKLAALTTALGVLITVGSGALSDRMRSRAPLVLGGSVLTAIGFVMLAFAHDATVLFLAAIPLAHGSIASTQILAHGRHLFASTRPKAFEAANAKLRSWFSFGFLIGPALGSVMFASFGARPTFILAAVLALALAFVGSRGLDRGSASSVARASEHSPIALGRVVVYMVAMVCLLVGDLYRASFFSVFLHETLGLSKTIAVLLFSVSSLVNLLLMPLIGRAADAWGSTRMLMVGSACGAAWMIASSVGGVVVVLASQLVYSIYVSTIYTLGMSKGQRAASGRSGLGVALFSGALGIASMLANLVGGWLADAQGVRAPFGFAALGCVIGALLVVGLASSESRPGSR